MNSLLLIILFISVSIKQVSNNLDICGDWMSYKNEKCYKIFNKLGTEEEAKYVCNQLDVSSTLISVGSEEEQIFLNKLFVKYENISDKVWLGMNTHDLMLSPWNGGKAYTNWADGSADLIGYHSCVQMSISKASLGKWTDEPCRRKGLIACQRKQEWTVNILMAIIGNISQKLDSIKIEEYMSKQNGIIESLKHRVDRQQNLMTEQNMTIDRLNRTLDKKLNKINKELAINEKSLQNPIPLGFAYVQLPNQSEPLALWPTLKWTDITQEYSGLFFRVEGLKSEPFGRIQSANYSRITNIMSAALVDVNYTKVQGKQYEIEEGGWTTNLVPAKALSDLYIYQSEGENRPQNTAVRVWKRTG